MAADNARSVSGQGRQPFTDAVFQHRVVELLDHGDHRFDQDIWLPNTSPTLVTLSTMLVCSTTSLYVASCPS